MHKYFNKAKLLAVSAALLATLTPAGASAFDAGLILEMKSEMTEEIIAGKNLHVAPNRQDGVVYAYPDDLRRIVKIGVGNDFGRRNYFERNEEVRRKNLPLNFDMTGRCVVRGLLYKEAATVERMLHMTYQDQWIVPAPGRMSSEVFAAPIVEVCATMRAYASAIMLTRNTQDREIMANYNRSLEHARHPAMEADDVTDWDEARDQTTLSDADKARLKVGTDFANANRNPLPTKAEVYPRPESIQVGRKNDFPASLQPFADRFRVLQHLDVEEKAANLLWKTARRVAPRAATYVAGAATGIAVSLGATPAIAGATATAGFALVIYGIYDTTTTIVWPLGKAAYDWASG